MAQERKKVLVLGAGYAGLQTITKLQKQLSADEAEITLINKNDYHYEATWLHEASAGTISYEDVLYPVESVINKNKVNFIKAEVTKIDRNAKKVETDAGIFDFDILVVALGFESETFGIKGMKDHAFQIENILTARKLARHIEDKFANYAASKNKDDKCLAIIVAGAGFESETCGIEGMIDHAFQIENILTARKIARHIEDKCANYAACKDKDDKDLAIIVGGAGFSGVEFLGELTDRIPELCNKYGV